MNAGRVICACGRYVGGLRRLALRVKGGEASARQIVVIDNCVDAGATFRAARAALPPGASLLALAATDACGAASATGADMI